MKYYVHKLTEKEIDKIADYGIDVSDLGKKSGYCLVNKNGEPYMVDGKKIAVYIPAEKCKSGLKAFYDYVNGTKAAVYFASLADLKEMGDTVQMPSAKELSNEEKQPEMKKVKKLDFDGMAILKSHDFADKKASNLVEKLKKVADLYEELFEEATEEACRYEVDFYSIDRFYETPEEEFEEDFEEEGDFEETVILDGDDSEEEEEDEYDY